MAKRYKKRKKRHYLRNILPIFILLVITIVVMKKEKIFKIREETIEYEGIKTIPLEETEEVIQEINVSKYRNLDSNVLNIINLKEEIEEILQEIIREKTLIKINYKLKKLEEGSIFLEYLIEEDEKEIMFFKIKIDVKTGKIEEIQKVKRKSKEREEEILNNLSEDIEEDYKLKQEELNKKNDSYVNIIITEKEIVINLAIEN